MPSPSTSNSKYPTTTDELAVRPRGLTTHPDSTIARIENAASLDALTSHEAPGMYSVTTPDHTYTVDLLSGTTNEPAAACTCPDYQYRCAEASIDCKHIHHVKHRIKNGQLAPPSTNPEVWMREYTDTLLDCLPALTTTPALETTLENIVLLAGDTTYDIDPKHLTRWLITTTQRHQPTG